LKTFLEAVQMAGLGEIIAFAMCFLLAFLLGVSAGEGSERRRILREKFIVNDGKVYICKLKRANPDENRAFRIPPPPKLREDDEDGDGTDER
jgi:hypothetical protein